MSATLEKAFDTARREIHTIPTFGVEIHPDANTVRMMDDDEYAALLADIREHGQLVPATICQGKLLDGRNRLKACKELGIGIWVENVGDSDIDTVAMVYSLNVTRRHLNTAERAFMGADMANIERGHQPNRGNRHIKSDDVEKSKMDFSSEPRKYTRHEAAAVVECSPQDITAARNVRKYAPELEEKAKAGEIHIREAERLAKKKRDGDKPKPQPKKPATVTPITQTEAVPHIERDVDVMAEAVAAIPQLPPSLDSALQDFTSPHFMIARGLKEGEEEIRRHLQSYGRQDRKRMLATIGKVMQHQQRIFEASASTQMPKYNKELQDKLKAELDAQRKLTQTLQRMATEKFGAAEYKQIISALHPDRDASKEKREKALALFQRLEPLFR